MTTLQIKEMLDEMEIPVAYHHFPTSAKVTLPFLAYQYPSNNPFFADGYNYGGSDIYDLDIRLCTETKDFELEKQLETLLKTNEIPFSKIETWIDSENMFEILYECEVIINE